MIMALIFYIIFKVLDKADIIDLCYQQEEYIQVFCGAFAICEILFYLPLLMVLIGAVQ